MADLYGWLSEALILISCLIAKFTPHDLIGRDWGLRA